MHILIHCLWTSHGSRKIICNVIIHVYMSVSFSGSFIKLTFSKKIFSNESEVLFHWNCNIFGIYLLALLVLCVVKRDASAELSHRCRHIAHLLEPILLPHQYNAGNYTMWRVRWCIAPTMIGCLSVDLHFVLSIDEIDGSIYIVLY